MKRNQQGFTLIEILMVVMLVAIMALVAIPQYLDFQVKAKDEATRGALGALRTAIANQKAQLTVKCDKAADQFPDEDAVTGNSIVIDTGTGNYCSVGQVPSAGDRPFVSGGYPANPWGGLSAVAECNGCNSTTRTACDGATYSGGWCYDEATGVIYADSADSTGGTLENTF